MSNPYSPDPYGSSSSYDPYSKPAETYPQYSQSGDPYSQYSQSQNPYSQPSPPPPYTPPAQPVYVQPVIIAQPTNGKATAALVLGLLSFLFWFLTGIPAVILGHMALNEINASNGTQGGKGSAIAGLILGYIAVGFLAICIFCYLLGGLASLTSPR
jgi:hypothetical protein